MAQTIFVNLPVKDLAASREFFTALGYSINPQFSDDNAAFMYGRGFADLDGHHWEVVWMDTAAAAG